MSLLMEALKKAERAKQRQPVTPAEQSGPPGGAAEAPNSATAPSQGLSLLPQEGDAGHADTTGAGNFPPITATLDTPSPMPDLAPLPTEGRNAAPVRVEPTASALELALDEPLPGMGAAAAALPPGSPPRGFPHPNLLPEGEGAKVKSAGFDLAEPEARPQPAASISPARHAEGSPKAAPQDIGKIAAAQQKAKMLFTARRPARSRALLLTGAATAVALGLGGFGFYYWQITSTGTLAIPASPPQVAPADAGAPQRQDAPAAPAQNPADETVPSPVAAPAMAPASPPATTAADDPARPEARSGAESLKGDPAIRIRQSAATSQLNPTLGKAYQSFLSGDTGTAQQLYQKVLQQEPNNRDALLGMAAIALKHKQADQAAAYYGKLLELDPTDPDALSALIGLQGQADSTQSESRLKKVLLQNPQADAAHFALGNLYSQQSRWAEAQQSYFRAYSSAPGNADYAFNLAVSLDHLNQGRLALDYYQRALAQPGPTNFDKSSVQTRIRELTSSDQPSVVSGQ